MGITIEKKQGVGKVSVQTKKDKFPAETEEIVGEIVSAEVLANVGVSMSYTKNLGNYESARIQVDLHMPCMPDEIDDTFTSSQEWVDEKLTAIAEEMEQK